MRMAAWSFKLIIIKSFNANKCSCYESVREGACAKPEAVTVANTLAE